MKLTSKAAAINRLASIKGQLANAAQALRVADTKLGSAVDDCAKGTIDWADLLEACFNARIYARMLDSSAYPALAPRVFRAIADYVNQDSRNGPHMEGAILALRLAERCLEAALGLAGQLDGEEIDAAYVVPFAALGTIRQYGSLLRNEAHVMNEERILGAIVAGNRPVLSAA